MRKVHFYDLDFEWRKFVNDLNTTPARKRVPFMAENLPEDHVPRTAEFDHVLSLLLERASGEPVAVTTALRGAGGFGKTVLARAICHDEDVQDAFGDDETTLGPLLRGAEPELPRPRLEPRLRLPDLPHPALIRTLACSRREMLTCAIDPSRQLIAAGGGDTRIRVWDVLSGAERLNLPGHLSGVSQLAFSADGERLVSAGCLRRLQWNAAAA